MGRVATRKKVFCSAPIACAACAAALLLSVSGSAEPVPVERADRDPAGEHFHDGFYLRLGIGLGYSYMSLRNAGDDSTDSSSLAGLAIPLELAMGGTLAPGWVLGIGSYGAGIPSPRAKNGDEALDTENSQVFSTIGPFIDYYFLPDRGFHAQAAFGFAMAPFTFRDDGEGYETKGEPKGWTAMLGVGWESWVGEQWGIGALARIQYARLKLDEITLENEGDEIDTSEVDLSGHLLVPALLFTATLH
jgi:hypothetical protein